MGFTEVLPHPLPWCFVWVILRGVAESTLPYDFGAVQGGKASIHALEPVALGGWKSSRHGRGDL